MWPIIGMEGGHVICDCVLSEGDYSTSTFSN